MARHRHGLGVPLADVFRFPETVNEVAARWVAAMVVVLSLATVVSGEIWMLALLTYGFAARVATGPTLSPMGLVATRVIVPLVGRRGRLTPGPPKRFAQSVGLLFSVVAMALYFGVDSATPYRAVLGTLTMFAALEAVFGFCAGCFVFGLLMRWGAIPESVCQACRRLEAA